MYIGGHMETYQVHYMSKRGAGMARCAKSLEEVATLLEKLAARKIDATARGNDGRIVGEAYDHDDPEVRGFFWWAER
jgi:hypothetical protein